MPSTSDTLRIDVQTGGPAAIVRLIGAADMNVTDQLRERLVGLVDSGQRMLVLDLAELKFINSMGLGAIIAAHLRCRHCKTEIRLVAPQPPIREVLRITRLDKLFPIFASLEEALA
jgi:anti-sigma B factor antagonist